MSGAVITGWGSAQPSEVVTNADLEARLDTNDAWILERTGIRERRVGGTTTGLAVEAGRQALTVAGVDAADVQLLMVSTNTPDQPVPSTSALVQDALGTGGGVFDLNSGCSGFVYGLVAANGIVATGLERVLLVASDTVSRIVDPADRGTAILFGDGAGAVMLQAATDDGMLLGWDLGADGSAAPLLYRMDGGYVVMDGKEVFRKAVRVTVASAKAALENAKVDEREIALFIPHQANVRIIEAVDKRLGISMDKTVVNVDTAGNTSSASIPLALAEAANQGRLQEGDLVLMAGFGAGMTWASAVVRWGRS